MEACCVKFRVCYVANRHRFFMQEHRITQDLLPGSLKERLALFSILVVSNLEDCKIHLRGGQTTGTEEVDDINDSVSPLKCY